MINPHIPLTDIHRHLDGNIRPQTILELGRQFTIELPGNDLASLRPHVQIVDNEPDLLRFLQKLDWGVAVLADRRKPITDEKARENLFQPFRGGVRAGGNGLGLAIAAELVRGHGGTLALLESGARGTVFRILLPQEPARMPQRDPAATGPR